MSQDPRLRALAQRLGKQYGLPFFETQIGMESGFDPSAHSPAGAIGVAQFMPGTAAGLGIDPNNPQQALVGAAKLMRSYMDKYHDPAKALAAYNEGEGNLAKYGVNGLSETRNYVSKILGSSPSTSTSSQGTSGPFPASGGSGGLSGLSGALGAGTGQGIARQALLGFALARAQAGSLGMTPPDGSSLLSLMGTLKSLGGTGTSSGAPASSDIFSDTTPTSFTTDAKGTTPTSGSYKFLQPTGGASLSGVNPKLLSSADSLGQFLHKPITVESGYRDYAKQAALYQRYKNSGFDRRYIAAKPGTSNHERGQALDLTLGGVPIANAVKAELLRRFGLQNPVAGDLPHTTLIGVNG